MTLVQMHYFNELCKYKNITHTANACHISQPSLSAAIKDLEEEFGVQLVERMSKGIKLTSAGIVFQRECTAVLNAIAHLEEAMDSLHSVPNPVQIGVPPMIGNILFPAICQAFKTAYPSIGIVIEDSGSENSRKSVLERKMPLALVSDDGFNTYVFNSVRIYRIQMLCYVGKTHRFAQREKIKFEELAYEGMVLLREDTYEHRYVTTLFSKMGISPNVLMKSSKFNVIHNLISANSAVAILFDGIFHGDSTNIGIPFDPPIYVDVDLIWNKNVNLDDSSKTFVEFVKKFYGVG